MSLLRRRRQIPQGAFVIKKLCPRWAIVCSFEVLFKKERAATRKGAIMALSQKTGRDSILTGFPGPAMG